MKIKIQKSKGKKTKVTIKTEKGTIGMVGALADLTATKILKAELK
jgi:hypothetical protein